jgi:hypothetical protein
VPEPIAALITRGSPAAVVMNDFMWQVYGVSRATPYPAQRIAQAMEGLS